LGIQIHPKTKEYNHNNFHHKIKFSHHSKLHNLINSSLVFLELALK